MEASAVSAPAARQSISLRFVIIRVTPIKRFSAVARADTALASSRVYPDARDHAADSRPRFLIAAIIGTIRLVEEYIRWSRRDEGAGPAACRGAQWPRDAARNANDEVLPAEQIKRLDGLFGEETMTAETWRSDLP